MHKNDYPELVVGLVGPIGCDITLVQEALSKAFKGVDYQPMVINTWPMIKSLLTRRGLPLAPNENMRSKIKAGNDVREAYRRNGTLAVEAMREILAIRSNQVGATNASEPIDSQLSEIVLPQKNVYIIRQLKRKEEVEFLQEVYGKQFIQVSISQSREARLANLVRRIQVENPLLTPEGRSQEAQELMALDDDESGSIAFSSREFGQQIVEVFHRADVFIDASSKEKIDGTCQRFVDLLFGLNYIGPTKDEYGSYLAKAASLRSVDLSRQVGAAILNDQGDVLALGCNEVAKAQGGNYWQDDAQKHRDIDQGIEPNEAETNRIIADLLRTLESKGVLDAKWDAGKIFSDDKIHAAIASSLIGGITEYGRVVHAEMNAVAEAARLGRSLKGSTLYVTTFPCHNCAKHIIACGIERVVFIEPYPKSRTLDLFDDEMVLGMPQDGRIGFEHFSGLSPRRYRDLLEKKKRRSSDGQIMKWFHGEARPMLCGEDWSYLEREKDAMTENAWITDEGFTPSPPASPAPPPRTPDDTAPPPPQAPSPSPDCR